MSNSIVRLDFSELLSPDEREMFTANAKVAGRKPSQHLRHLLLGEKGEVRKPAAQKKGGKR